MGDIYGAHSNDNKKERSSSVLCSKGTVRTNRAWTIEQRLRDGDRGLIAPAPFRMEGVVNPLHCKGRAGENPI